MVHKIWIHRLTLNALSVSVNHMAHTTELKKKMIWLIFRYVFVLQTANCTINIKFLAILNMEMPLLPSANN